MEAVRDQNEHLDMELEQTFPASDPIPWIHDAPDTTDHGERGAALYFDDFHAGQRFESSELTVTVEQIKSFAARFDPQPFHLDEEAARGTVFGELVASGWLTAALTMRLLVEGPMRVAGGLVGAGGEISWPRPTKPGDVLQVQSEVVEIKPSQSKRDRGIVKVRSLTLNQRGEPVQTALMNLIVPRRRAS
jgi:acyl dehydratase